MRRCLVAGGVGSHVLGIQMLTAPSWAATLQSGSLGGRHRGQPHSKVAVWGGAIVGSHTPKWQFRSLSSLAAVHVGWIILDHIGSYWIILDHIGSYCRACWSM